LRGAAVVDFSVKKIGCFLHNKNAKAVGAAGRRSGRNERIVVSAKRDGKRHGPPMIQTVAARAVGWRSEMSTANRPHGPARR